MEDVAQLLVKKLCVCVSVILVVEGIQGKKQKTQMMSYFCLLVESHEKSNAKKWIIWTYTIQII